MAKQYTFFSFVEDEATKSVVLRLFDYVRDKTGVEMLLAGAHPVVTHGYGKLKEKAVRLRQAAQSGVRCFFLTDLDAHATPNELGRSWFGVKCLSELPEHFIFRISVREIESWIMADVSAFAAFLGVSEANFPGEFDSLPDPKRFLFNLIRSKVKRKRFLDMLPLKGQHVGVNYNPVLMEFVREHWDVERAAEHSASLARSIVRMCEAMCGGDV